MKFIQIEDTFINIESIQAIHPVDANDYAVVCDEGTRAYISKEELHKIINENTEIIKINNGSCWI